MMNAITFVLLAVIALSAYAIPIVPDLLPLKKCDKGGETDCGLVAVSLRCEKTGCEHTNVCAHVCTSVLDSVLNVLTGQCVCKEGYYRDQNGLCISLETCLDADADARKRRGASNTCNKEHETDCGLVEASLRCEQKCGDNTQVCVNVCSGLLGDILGQLTGQCVCEQGYFRDRDGLCVSANLCAIGTVSG
uniref:EGF-like domain-containing protein n=1 Tax=Plectus sambesii TaxID=2011161 RepID=A0A914UZ89_9BILA